jgi:Tfp pilus assembly protein PilX
MKMNKRESGATLVVSLVMLVVLTMLVVTAIRSSTSNMRIAGNMQAKAEATAAGQQAIEQVISNNFTAAPTEVHINVDTAGTTYAVKVTKPTCDSTKGLTNDELVASDPLDQVCMGSGLPQNTGIIDASGHGGSTTTWCYKQQWDVQADVTEENSGVSVTQHQGVALRVPAGTTC